MPPALVAYWTAWNSPTEDGVDELLASAVTDDVLWHDPRDAFTGRAALRAAIRALRAERPDHRFLIASEVDHHHDRYRYRWDMVRRDRVLMEGLDIAEIEPGSGLIRRIDGFFGAPTPIADPSGVPAALRRAEPPATDHAAPRRSSR